MFKIHFTNKLLKTIFKQSFNNISYRFSSEKQNSNTKQTQSSKPTQNEQKLKTFDYESQLNEEQKTLIDKYKLEKTWSQLLQVSETHNFQKQIIIRKKQYQRSTKQLRASILFEDILKSQVLILIYDTQGKPFIHEFLKHLYVLMSVALALWSIWRLSTIDPNNKVILDKTTYGKILKYFVYIFSVLLILKRLKLYITYQSRYVQKIVYDTNKEQFNFTMRNFFGLKYNYSISRFKLLYTENQFLRKMNVNYFEIDKMKQFSIGYKSSWKKQDLFSHLISQRIQL